jgi:hypothetical protein
MLDSTLTLDAILASSSIHSKTGRAADAERSTHFQLSASMGAFEGVRRN